NPIGGGIDDREWHRPRSAHPHCRTADSADCDRHDDCGLPDQLQVRVEHLKLQSVAGGTCELPDKQHRESDAEDRRTMFMSDRAARSVAASALRVEIGRRLTTANSTYPIPESIGPSRKPPAGLPQAAAAAAPIFASVHRTGGCAPTIYSPSRSRTRAPEMTPGISDMDRSLRTEWLTAFNIRAYATQTRTSALHAGRLITARAAMPTTAAATRASTSAKSA